MVIPFEHLDYYKENKRYFLMKIPLYPLNKLKRRGVPWLGWVSAHVGAYTAIRRPGDLCYSLLPT